MAKQPELQLANLWIAVNKNRIKTTEHKLIQDVFNAGFKAGFNEGKSIIKTPEPQLPLGDVIKSVCIECSNEGGTHGVNGWKKCSKGCE